MSLHSRRQFLRFAGTGLAALAAGRSGFAAPAIIQSEITPQAFGARGNAETDAAGWTQAIREASGTGRPVVAHGTFVLRVADSPSWNWARRTECPAFVAVPLASDVQIQGDAEILVGRPAREPLRNDRHFLFATGMSEEQGAMANIGFDGLRFDFRDEFGPVHTYTYAIGAIGVDNLKRSNLRIESTGAQAGRGLLSENVRGRSDSNLQHANIIQGIYTRYEYGVTMKDISFDRFNEACDFDGPSWDVLLERMSFRRGLGREGQCIDTGGGARWIIRDIVAEDTGPIAYMYIKGSSLAAGYKAWLGHDPDDLEAECAPPSDMTLSNIRGTNAGGKRKKSEALLIGRYRGRQWLKRQPRKWSPRNITVEDWQLDGGGQITVGDCENLTMRRVTMTGTNTPPQRAMAAALVLREAEAEAGGVVSGTVANVTIRNSGGLGVIAAAGPDLRLDDITVEGFGSMIDASDATGVVVKPRPGGRDRPTLGKITVSGGPAGARSVDADGPADAPDPQVVRMKQRRRRSGK